MRQDYLQRNEVDTRNLRPAMIVTGKGTRETRAHMYSSMRLAIAGDHQPAHREWIAHLVGIYERDESHAMAPPSFRSPEYHRMG